MTRIDRTVRGLRSLVAQGAGVVIVAGWFAACAVDEPTASHRVGVGRANLAKSAPSGITVTSADPDSAVQGDVQKTVHVHGSGFALGAKATWSVNGDTTQIVTNSTTFVSSTEVVAVITVSATAPVGSYDIVVTNLGGKKGVGVELFAVKNPEVILGLTIDDTGPLGDYHIRSDGLGEYVDGLQSVTARIDTYGNLKIYGGVPRTSLTMPERTFTFDFSAPVDPLNTYLPDTPEMNFKILSNKTNNGNPRIQDLGINGNPVSGCYNVTMNFTSQTANYRQIFNVAVDSNAAYVYITRTTIAPGAWTMVTNGPCSGVADQARLTSQDLTGKKAGPLVTRGLWNLRFSMRIRER